VIDLHIHSTASDGWHQPADVVALAARAGLTTIALTDHDTLGGWPEASAAAAASKIRLIAGIEITAVHNGRDIHILAYGVDPDDEPLRVFLARQRELRIERVRQIAHRLADRGAPVDLDAVLASSGARTGKTIGRPAIARALVDAGHVPDMNAAFTTWLGFGRPAFVARTGEAPASVIAVIRRAGGVASLAHPVLLRGDGIIESLAEHGLHAIEAYHSEHLPEDTDRYRIMARRLGLALTGGSDFHGDPAHGTARLGTVTLPADDFAVFDELLQRAARAYPTGAAEGGPGV
jgi:predicted metal-dependent phosphoesterase TrpH